MYCIPGHNIICKSSYIFPDRGLVSVHAGTGLVHVRDSRNFDESTGNRHT
jgi:hypothetical protein